MLSASLKFQSALKHEILYPEQGLFLPSGNEIVTLPGTKYYILLDNVMPVSVHLTHPHSPHYRIEVYLSECTMLW